MVERKTLNLVVVGSSPTEGAFFFPNEEVLFVVLFLFHVYSHNIDWVAEWSKAPV